MIRKNDPDDLHKGNVYIDGEKYKVFFRFSGPYAIGVAWSVAATAKQNMMALTLVGGYLVLAALIIVYMLVKILKTREERTISLTFYCRCRKFIRACIYLI